MFDEVCVPHNGSPETHRAVEVGAALAEATGTELRVLAYTNPEDHTVFSERFYDELFDVGRRHGLTPHVTPLESKRFLSDAIVAEMRSRPGAVLCMASRGRGRAAVLLGSLTADVLTYGPGTAILCGPECRADALERSGPILVALDGGADAESALHVVDEWLGPLDRRVELVEVLSSTPSKELAAAIASGDVAESGYLTNVVRHHPELGGDVDYEVLHGKPVDAIIDEAERRDAVMIVMVTRVPLGVDRLLHGSVTDGVVHESPVPVLAMRASAPFVAGADEGEDDEDVPFQVQMLWM